VLEHKDFTNALILLRLTLFVSALNCAHPKCPILNAMKKLLPLLLLGSITLAQSSSTYSVTDVALYGLNERHIIFSGEPQSIKTSLGTPLALTKSTAGTGNAAFLEVPGSLQVGSASTLKLPTKPLEAFKASKQGASIMLEAKTALMSVYYFNGTSWFTLARQVAAGQSAVFTPTARQSLYGAGMLSSVEALALGKYLASKGEFVVATLSTASLPDARVSFTPIPSAYRRSALAVQVGLPETLPEASTPIETPPVVAPAVPSEPIVTTPTAPGESLQVRQIGAGSNSTHGETEFMTRYDTSYLSFLETWRMVSGNQIPMPAAPFVNFNQSRVVTVFLGQRPTSGYGLQFQNASLDGRTLILTLQISEPPADRITLQVITSPYVMLEVNNTNFDAVQVELGGLQTKLPGHTNHR
jgi:hypothetical protein